VKSPPSISNPFSSTQLEHGLQTAQHIKIKNCQEQPTEMERRTVLHLPVGLLGTFWDDHRRLSALGLENAHRNS